MGNSFLLVVVGLLLFYLVISDKFYCLEGAIACMTGSKVDPATPKQTAFPSSLPPNVSPNNPPVLNPAIPRINTFAGLPDLNLFLR